MEQVASRRLLGIASVVVIGLVGESLPSGPAPAQLMIGEQHVFVPSVWDIIAAIAVFGVGGYIARVAFAPIAAVIFVAMWLIAQYILYRIALPTGQADLMSIAFGNLPSLFILTASAAAGAFAGEQIYKQNAKPSL